MSKKKNRRNRVTIPGTVPLGRTQLVHEIKNRAAEIVLKPSPGYGLYVHNLYLTGTLVVTLQAVPDKDKSGA